MSHSPLATARIINHAAQEISSALSIAASAGAIAIKYADNPNPNFTAEEARSATLSEMESLHTIFETTCQSFHTLTPQPSVNRAILLIYRDLLQYTLTRVNDALALPQV